MDSPEGIRVKWDWSKVDEVCSQRRASWRLVPTEDQRYKEQAEWIIGLLKLCLEQTLEGKQCRITEVETLLGEANRAPNQQSTHHHSPLSPEASHYGGPGGQL
jgi:hypothetical protein